MLLEVALDLDAEAEAIEADRMADRPELRPSDLNGALLHMVGPNADTRPAQVLNLSVGGARFRVDRHQTPGSKVILELPARALRLDGTILRAQGMDAAMIFDSSCRTAPDLSRLLGHKTRTEPVGA
jgi:hypothetical protein